MRTLHVQNEVKSLDIERKRFGVPLTVLKRGHRTVTPSGESCRGGGNVEADQPPGGQPMGEVGRPATAAAADLDHVEAAPGAAPRAGGRNAHVELQRQALGDRRVDHRPPILALQRRIAIVHRRPVGLRVSSRHVFIQ